jgi:hypothetical protein
MAGAILAVVLLLFVLNLGEDTPAGRALTAVPAGERPPDFKRGEELSRTFCGSCHLYPEPALLDKFTWSYEVLPSMAVWLGLHRFEARDHPGAERVLAAKIIPDRPQMSIEDWRAICNFYMAAAPASPPPQPERPPLTIGLPHFQPVIPAYPKPPANCLVRITREFGGMFIGNSAEGVLDLFHPEGTLLASMNVGGPPTDLRLTAEGLYVTVIGSVAPSDVPEGRLLFLPRAVAGAEKQPEPRTLLAGLQRPTEAVFVDLNKDGREDIIVPEFGWYLGRFGWHENLGDGTYREHVLLERPGAMKVQVHDLGNDGLPDIFLMTAQSREGIYLFLNRGQGQFLMLPVLEQHPAWGFSYFELADFNGDGHPDILATNGDNGDNTRYPEVPRHFHGVRVYLNDGKNQFKERFFYPMHGAYKAVARDFDLDGDLDIAAIAYYPDYNREPPVEGFVYLQNVDGSNFAPFSCNEAALGKWICLDAADGDGDGDIDIVLGAHNHGAGIVPPKIRQQWSTNGASILMLLNTAADQRAAAAGKAPVPAKP